jgi:hypothetical protein
MDHRPSAREQARKRLSQIEREITEILDVFPELRPRRRTRRRTRTRTPPRPAAVLAVSRRAH